MLAERASEFAGPWRTKHQRYRLEGTACHHCEEKMFPPRVICTGCGENVKEVYQFSGKGIVYSSTTVKDAPLKFEKYEPFTIALIKLDEGPLVTAQLTGFDNKTAEIGVSVEMVTRELYQDGPSGQIVYGYKFRPEVNSTTAFQPELEQVGD